MKCARPSRCRSITKRRRAPKEQSNALPEHAKVVHDFPSAPVPSASQSGEKREANDFPFSVAVSSVYEGPLDLLLDLVRKQDIDIYDIPIAKITAQYLAYVEKLRELDVNVAAEFIYMAAVLIHIKSKMLLPRDPAAASEEQEDPRAELESAYRDRKSTRLNSSHSQISYAVFCLKKKKKDTS